MASLAPDGTPIKLGFSDFAKSYVQDQAEQLMDSVIQVTSPATVYDPVTRRSTSSLGSTRYEGPARIWEVPAGSVTIIGDDEIIMTQSRMSIPMSAPVPQHDDMILIVESSDPDLVGKTVNIDSVVQGGTIVASRQFAVTISSRRDTY